MNPNHSNHPLGRLAAALALLLAAAAAAAQVPDIPQMISYQGYLTDDAGEPVDGVRSIEFAIHTGPSGAGAAWSETHEVTLTAGVFTVLLGSVNPIPYAVFDGGERYLAVRVGGGEELAPRQRLVSAGYCFKAHDAELLDGRAAADFARSVDGVKPQNGNVDLVAGSNVTITPDAESHSVTIASTLNLPFSSTVSSNQNALTVVNGGTGYAMSASSTTYAIRATSTGASGYGLYGVANGENARGVVGSTSGANGYGVWGFSNSHRGVYGSSRSGTGVYGQHVDSGNFGFLGNEAYGAYGEFEASGGFGWLGGPAFGVYGQETEDSRSNSGYLGGEQAGAGGRSNDGYGVFGYSTDSDGVRGQSANGNGVRGISDETTPGVAGVLGVGTHAAAGVIGRSSGGPGVHGQSEGGPAVYAEGDLEVTGSVVARGNLEVAGTYDGDLELDGAFKGNIDSASSSDGAPFPRPAFDSGWVDAPAGHDTRIDHDIGGDADDYFVDMQVRYLGKPSNKSIGGDTRSATTAYGTYYYGLTNEAVWINRYSDDTSAERVRIRIWVIR
jgi:hypothetical protein